MLLGAFIWFTGALRSGMDDNIADNKLKTDGIYAWGRNPMYSGIWIFNFGLSLMWHNACLVPIVAINWLIMTIALKNMEKKWLLDLYGNEYAEYKKKVNRCIPWLPEGTIRGDVNSLIELGEEMIRRGHEFRILTSVQKISQKIRK